MARDSASGENLKKVDQDISVAKNRLAALRQQLQK